MKILVACEESQAVASELLRLGHDAYSCDLIPCSGQHPDRHIIGDVLPYLNESHKWDMVIAFPPCTHLAISGARHFKQKIADGRQQQGIDFFMNFVHLLEWCPRVAIENPIGIMSTHYRKPDQIIQPYQFGHSVTKATCLWLKGLPLLKPTNIVDKGSIMTFASGKRMHSWYNEQTSHKHRAKHRSKTFPGIATAMAEQWTA